MKLDYSVSVPKGQHRSKRGYSDAVREFVNAGAACALVGIDADANALSAYVALYRACNRIGGTRIVKRGSELYLVRDGAEK
jgi:hypothetical protein